MTKLTIEQASTLNTARLLAYYKKYAHSFQSKYICGCCGEFIWNNEDMPGKKQEYEAEVAYWDSIKAVLNTREHVPLKNNHEVNSTKKH